MILEKCQDLKYKNDEKYKKYLAIEIKAKYLNMDEFIIFHWHNGA